MWRHNLCFSAAHSSLNRCQISRPKSPSQTSCQNRDRQSGVLRVCVPRLFVNSCRPGSPAALASCRTCGQYLLREGSNGFSSPDRRNRKQCCTYLRNLKDRVVPCGMELSAETLTSFCLMRAYADDRGQQRLERGQGVSALRQWRQLHVGRRSGQSL